LPHRPCFQILLGCLGRGPTGGLKAKGLKSAPGEFGKFSDVAGANRLEADLPEVNLPLRDFVGNERSARMADRHLPGALNFAEGLTALHGIEAEPECR